MFVYLWIVWIDDKWIRDACSIYTKFELNWIAVFGDIEDSLLIKCYMPPM
jgi:hypothetical protein